MTYNLDFDLRILHESARAQGLPGGQRRGLATCAMELYAMFYGDWSEYHQSYRWQKLHVAARQCGIKIPPDLHRARADAELCRRIVHHVAGAAAGQGDENVYECPVLHFKACDGEHECDGKKAHSAMDESVTGHRLHCPDCDVHLTSLLLCPKCNTRFEVRRHERAKPHRPRGCLIAPFPPGEGQAGGDGR